MPKPKQIPYLFTPREASSITGISLHMLDYLHRTGYLQPAYVSPRRGVRGKVRYYSYRDLVVARTIQRLRDTGVELARLKEAMQTLARYDTWKGSRDGVSPLPWLVTDGKEVFLRDADGYLDQLRPNGQRAFGFVVSLTNIQNEVKALIPHEKLGQFSMRNKPFPASSVAGDRRRRDGE